MSESVPSGGIEELSNVVKQPEFEGDELPWGYNRAEMVPWLYKSNYRDVKVRIVEFDHRKTEQLPEEIDFPPFWREALERQILNSDGSLMIEYFVPELENTVYSIPVLGMIAREKGDVENVTPFFGFAAKVCGREGRTIQTADPNLSPGTFLLQRANLLLGHHVLNSLRGKGLLDSMEDYYGKPHLKDLSGIEKIVSVDDARRLYTARAMLTLAIENQKERKSVTLITAPVHAERINYYINRQTEFEKASGKVPQNASDLSEISPSIESKKMKRYALLMKPVMREYKPVLPKTAFALDIVVNDYAREGYATRLAQWNIFDLDHFEKISEAVQALLDDITVENEVIKEYKSQVKMVLPLIEKMKADLMDGLELDQKELEKIEKLVSTHKIGWENTRNLRIS